MSDKHERKWQPLGDRVLVRLDEPQAVSKGGILIPDTGKEKPTTGEVLAVGESCELDAKDLTGRVVLFHNYSGSPAPHSKDLMFVKEKDLLAIEAK